MNKIFTGLIIILMAGCEKNTNNDTENIQYDFKVVRSYKSSDNFDSTIYYYSVDNKLIAYYDYIIDELHEYKVVYEADQIKINCESENISRGDKVFYISEGFRIDSIYHQAMSGSFILNYNFSYDNNKIISSERRNSIPELKYFYNYSEDMHVKDSIITIPYIDNHYKIIIYQYTDTLNPEYIFNECGLFEYPTKSDYLIRQTQTLDYYGGGVDIIYKKYSYDIKDKEIEIKISSNGIHEATIRYTLVENN